MSNDFQLRKDIDKIDRFVSQLDTVIADKGYEGLDELLEEYGESLEYLDTLFTDMNTLSTDLKELQDSLIEFNDALINFSDDNTNFANNLTKLKENLNKVLSQLNELKEGSAEFSDVLDDFGIDISTFVETLWGLNSDLTILSECLDAFMDDLDGFEDALEDAGIDTTGINEDYAKLVWAVGNVRNRTTTAESNIDDLLDDIGDDENFNPSTDTPSGIKQWIAWLQYTIGDDTEGEETGLIASILELSNQIGVDDPNNPTGIFADIATINGDINYIDGLINGDANHVGILNQIDTINNTDIPAVQQGISNYKTAMFGSSTGSESNYTADSIYGRMYAILHKDSNNNEVGRLPTMESNMTSATNRLDALLDTSVTPNTGRIPDLESQASTATSRLDAIYKNSGGTETGLIPNMESRINGITNTSGTGSLDVLESTVGDNNSGLIKKANDLDTKIGSDESTPKTGLYGLIDTASSNINNIINNIIGSSSDDVDDGDTTLWAYINQALNSISSAELVMGTDTPNTGSDTVWGRIHSLLTNLTNAEFSISSLLAPKVAFTYVFYLDHTGSPTSDDDSLIESIEEEYGLSNIIYACDTEGGMYKSSNDVWSSYNEYPSNGISIGKNIEERFHDRQSYHKSFWEMSWDYLYDYERKIYFESYNDPTNISYGYYGEWVECDGIVNDSFENTNLYDAIESMFSKLGHTHTKSEITDFTHSHTTSDISNFPSTMPPSSHSHTKSDISDFSHSHTTSDISNFPSTMPPSSHSHTASEISDGSTTFASINHSHSNWVENTSLTGNYHLFTNEALRMCILYIDGVSSGTTSTSDVTTVKTFSATEMPNPPLYNVYSNSSDYNHNIRITTDKKLQVMKGGTTSSIIIATQFIWHY